MATYIMLFSLTQQGMQNIKESPSRVEAAKQSFQALGARVREFYAVMGMEHYDTIFILDAPNDETAARAALAISSQGSVRTETHRLFTEEEYGKIIAGMR